jgi:SHS2 domain-containing protein
MEKLGSSGFREIEHTADRALKVWAPDLAGLFTQAALGMYKIMGVQYVEAPVITRRLTLSSLDEESLLVSFLSELLYFAESQRIAFDQINLQCRDMVLHAQLSGKRIAGLEQDIKAVTYHDLSISHETDPLNVKIVFDV